MRRGISSTKAVAAAVFGAVGISVCCDDRAKRLARQLAVVAHADGADWPPVLENWSRTHSCQAQRVLKPSCVEEVESIVKNMGANKLRVMGSGLSPNGLGFSDTNIVTLEKMNRVVKVDKKNKQVTVEAGALVGEVLEEIHEHGLTLQNLASINQQQIGGFTQAGAHGTGARLPPVEEQIVSMQIVSPGLGTIRLSNREHPEWFKFAKLGLGCFGVVTEITLQCVDAHKLSEDTSVMKQSEISKGHSERLQKNKHLRYMWLPMTDSAVVVASNPVSGKASQVPTRVLTPEQHSARTKPMVDLLVESNKSNPAGLIDSGGAPKNAERLGFGELRDWLLCAGDGILDTAHVERVNKAELAFWKNSEEKGVVDDSFNVLGFDCGGQQLVIEVAIPCGTLSKPDGRDLEFVKNLLEKIETYDIPAPSPIEQRWTCGSSAPMSPASNMPGDDSDPSTKLFSWVGIIMYLPTKDPMMRVATENRFYEYKRLLDDVNEEGEFNAQTHWAKLELPWAQDETETLQAKLRSRFPLKEFEEVRRKFDPNSNLTNNMMDVFLRGMPPQMPKPHSPGVRTTFNK